MNYAILISRNKFSQCLCILNKIPNNKTIKEEILNNKNENSIWQLSFLVHPWMVASCFVVEHFQQIEVTFFFLGPHFKLEVFSNIP